MESFVYLAFRFVLLFYALMLVLAPIALRYQFRYRAKFSPRVVEPEDLPEAARNFIQPKIKTIEAWGFELVNFLKFDMAAPGMQSFMALLANPHTHEWADISYVVATGKSRGYMEFITACSDGSQLDTNTNAIAPVLFPTPSRHIFRFPQIEDVFTLYRVHRMLVQVNLNSGYPVLPPEGQELTELQRRLERYGPWQQSRGYMYLDGPDGSYRLTWKGAIIGGWRSIWPVPQLRAWQMRLQSEAILQKIGVEPKQNAS